MKCMISSNPHPMKEGERKIIRGGSLLEERSLFQASGGGSIPTSPHNLELRRIDKPKAEMCYEKWHYLGKQGFISEINYGVYCNSKLYGCISFGSPNAKVLFPFYTPETQEGWWEVKRLALSDDLPKNSESRIIGVSIRLLKQVRKVNGIVTYADSGVGHEGTIYKASGFKYRGLTAPKSDFFEEGHNSPKQRGKIVGLKGEWRPRSRKHLFVKVFLTPTL